MEERQTGGRGSAGGRNDSDIRVVVGRGEGRGGNFNK